MTTWYISKLGIYFFITKQGGCHRIMCSSICFTAIILYFGTYKPISYISGQLGVLWLLYVIFMINFIFWLIIKIYLIVTLGTLVRSNIYECGPLYVDISQQMFQSGFHNKIYTLLTKRIVKEVDIKKITNTVWDASKIALLTDFTGC